MQRNEKMLSAEEIAGHRSTSSCWIVVDDKVYDVTSYLSEHPGGAAILLKQGGSVGEARTSYAILPSIASLSRV
jgi:L-lactate dehydrogenase (cytochrome)